MKFLKMLSGRVVIMILLVLIQVAWLVVSFTKLAMHIAWIRVVFTLLSLLMVLVIVKRDDNPAYKIGWILLIMAMPIFGGLCYLFFGHHRPARRMIRKLEAGKQRIRPEQLPYQAKRQPEGRIGGTIQYVREYGPYPAWQNTDTQFFPVGEKMYEQMLADLKAAQHYIFLEYFIITNGSMWQEILQVLGQKVQEGVEVRLMYDDLGSLGRVPDQYYKELEQAGIKALAFNPFVPLVSLVMNHRDHRKILVIDGYIAYNGGINLSDEYINRIHPYGHYKDTGVRYCGDAVWNFTLMFLEMWNAFRPEDSDFAPFEPRVHHPQPFAGQGYVQPFGDSPLDDENVAENVYLELIQQAQHYIDIYTPYLAIDNEMHTALCLAAKRGVTVRMLLPAVTDAKVTHILTHSYYESLIRAGVEIYEYTPGFIHAKCFVVDDELAVIGTINMDYRSLYLHFECGALHYQTEAVRQLRSDSLATFRQSRKLTLADCHSGFFHSLFYAVLRVIAPLM